MAIKKVKCLDNRGYNLTEESEYEVLAVEKGFYKVMNDNGKRARYSEEMFEITERVPGPQPADRTIEAAPVVATPPPPPRRTQRDVLASIAVNGNQVSFTDIDGVLKTLSNPLGYNDSSISCGIEQVHNIDGLLGGVDSMFGDEDDYLDEKKAVLKVAINAWIINRNTSRAFRTCSTTTNDNDEDLLSVFTELSTSPPSRRNPNSGNMIRIWVFTCTNE